MLGRLVELKIKGLPIPRQWYVVLRKGKRLSVAAEEFKLLLTNEAVDLLSSYAEIAIGAGPAMSASESKTRSAPSSAAGRAE